MKKIIITILALGVLVGGFIMINKKASSPILSDIKKIIYTETGIEVRIRNYDPPRLSIVVDNSPAASELHSQKNILINALQEYLVEKISIRTQ